MNFVYVDSVNGECVFCESEEGEKVVINFCDLPKNIKEGDILVLNEKNKWVIDEKATQNRRKEIINLRNEVYNKKIKSNIEI